LFVGPVFTREAVIAPRRVRTYVARVAYGGAILLVLGTAWAVLTGAQRVRDMGDFARFGMSLFQVLAPLQLAIALFFSALLAASAAAQEKDRRTLELLLLTKLSNRELVLGKLMASLLSVLMLLAVAFPLFILCALFGGVSLRQIGRVFAVTLASVLVCGSLGSTIALWREKTFQALALTMLVLVTWLAIWEAIAMGALGAGWWGLSAETWAAGFSPWEAILEASRPYVQADPALGPLRTPIALFLLVAVAIALVLNGVAMAMLRVWNPPREAQAAVREDETWHRASIWGEEEEHDPAPKAARTQPDRPAPRSRPVWDNPVIWREMVTWAYGRKILVVRLTYAALFALAAGWLGWMIGHGQTINRPTAMVTLGLLSLLSLVMVNAQAVTAMTSERDCRALDLLLVSDLTPKEIVYGKIGGVLYNTKEMIALPMLLCGALCYAGVLSAENLLYVVGGLAVLFAFAAMLGIHAGMIYANSRVAIGTSLGTVFFLSLGMVTCMWIMVSFSGSFGAQLPPFVAYMAGGGVGLYVALGARNPSQAIALASFLCPFATFYAITSLLLNHTLGVFLVTAAAYGFATAAMLIPAICEFDVATGRTTVGE